MTHPYHFHCYFLCQNHERKLYSLLKLYKIHYFSSPDGLLACLRPSFFGMGFFCLGNDWSVSLPLLFSLSKLPTWEKIIPCTQKHKIHHFGSPGGLLACLRPTFFGIEFCLGIDWSVSLPLLVSLSRSPTWEIIYYCTPNV